MSWLFSTYIKDSFKGFQNTKHFIAINTITVRWHLNPKILFICSSTIKYWRYFPMNFQQILLKFFHFIQPVKTLQPIMMSDSNVLLFRLCLWVLSVLLNTSFIFTLKKFLPLLSRISIVTLEIIVPCHLYKF